MSACGTNLCGFGGDDAFLFLRLVILAKCWGFLIGFRMLGWEQVVTNLCVLFWKVLALLFFVLGCGPYVLPPFFAAAIRLKVLALLFTNLCASFGKVLTLCFRKY